MSAMSTWHKFLEPCLLVLEDGQVRRGREVCDLAADRLGITSEQRREVLSSGHLRYVNRATWALSHLFRAGAVERPSRGQYVITDRGRQLLMTHAGSLTPKAALSLTRTSEEEGAQPVGVAAGDAEALEAEELSPSEQIEDGVVRLHRAVADELRARLHAQEPVFFEQAVLDLLMAMGYGGAEGAATRTQLTNDAGIDGIIDQDALGLSRIYVQAKRYDPTASVSRPDIQAFVGALHGASASQGVFITTARFTEAARQYANTVATRVVLIDGERLAGLMIRYGVGVQVRRTVQVVEVDEDFFE